MGLDVIFGIVLVIILTIILAIIRWKRGKPPVP